jgi:hypothetical protein
MGQATGQALRNIVDYVKTLDPAEAVRELECVLSAIGSVAEQLRDGADPQTASNVLLILSGAAEGMVEQIETKPGGLPAAPKEPGALCATKIIAAQLQSVQG